MEREVDLLLHELFDKNPYTRHGVTIQSDDCIVDLGANMGLFSLWCTQQAERLKIYACEPIPPLCQLVEENLRDQTSHQIHIEPRGIGLQPSVQTFSFFPKATACSTMYGRDTIEKMPTLYSDTQMSLSDLWSIHKGAFMVGLLCGPIFKYIRPWAIRTLLSNALSREERYSCEVCNLSDLFEMWSLDKIDLLKLDVQGAEADILLGVRDEHWPNISQVALEVNTFLGRSNEINIVSLLEAKGFKVIRDESPEIAAPGSYFIYALNQRHS